MYELFLFWSVKSDHSIHRVPDTFSAVVLVLED